MLILVEIAIALLLIGGMVIGAIATKHGTDAVNLMYGQLFQGTLMLFMLDMGMVAAAQLRGIGRDRREHILHPVEQQRHAGAALQEDLADLQAAVTVAPAQAVAVAVGVLHLEQLQSGDLVFFGPPERATHVGLYLGEGHYIHSSGKDQGRNGIGIDLLSEQADLVSQTYYRQLRGAGRVVASYSPVRVR